MKKLFIVGCPRSGTTMLQQALNRHSQIIIPPETKYFFSFLGHSRERQARHWQRINTDLQIDLPPLAKKICSATDARALYEQMAGRYTERLGRPDIAYFGEKTPEHTSRLSAIQKLFPDAKVIFIYRDGRDVALSLSKVPWMQEDLYVNFMIWLYYYRILLRARKSLFMDLYCVRYEDLVADPTVELSRILSFLNLPNEPAVAQGYGNHEGIPQREYGWKFRALDRINSDRIGTWQRELSTFQVNYLESLGREALQDLGYALATKQRESLPLLFRAKLGWNLLRLVYQLPWHAVTTEFQGASLGFS